VPRIASLAPRGCGSLHHISSVSDCCQAYHRAGHEECKEGDFGGDEARAVRVKELVGGCHLPAILDGSVEQHAVGFLHPTECEAHCGFETAVLSHAATGLGAELCSPRVVHGQRARWISHTRGWVHIAF
jgi:hypothetical protein